MHGIAVLHIYVCVYLFIFRRKNDFKVGYVSWKNVRLGVESLSFFTIKEGTRKSHATLYMAKLN